MSPKNRSEEIHWTHKISLELRETKPKKWSNNKPEMRLRMECIECNSYIKWPSRDEINHYNKYQCKNMTYEDFMYHFNLLGIKTRITSKQEGMVIKLTVPYSEKDIVKKLGAWWQPEEKYWYVHTSSYNLEKLIPWIKEPELTELHEWLSTCYNYKAYQ
jgi:hypothetical protein